LELAFSTSEPDFGATLLWAQLWFRKSRANKKSEKNQWRAGVDPEISTASGSFPPVRSGIGAY
jgi:hypothetical protein